MLQRRGAPGRIVVDNLHELQRLAARASEFSPVPVLLRINTGIEAHTHHFVRTAGPNSKFGFDPASLPEAIDILKAAAALRFIGLHAHIGSQIYEPDAFAANARVLIERAAYCAHAGLIAQIVVVGGGFGVPMHPERPEPIDLCATMGEIASMVAKESQRRSIPAPRIGIEPGRALIAAAGTSVYSVMAVKRQFDRAYAIVDGGIYENPRPALYDAYHHIVAASDSSERTVEMRVCGRTCENDELGTAKLPGDLKAGDLVAMCTTGAYTYSMASNYNRFSRPPVIAVRQGTHALIARRENVDDLLYADADA